MEETQNPNTEPLVAPMPEAPAPENEPLPEPTDEVGEEAVGPAPDYAALEQADLADLRAEFPETGAIRSLSELDDPARYGQLRDLGLTPREAYLATSKRQRVRIDNRSHLQSAMPRAVAGGGGGITPRELEEARGLFSDLSDSEIRRLYQKVKA